MRRMSLSVTERLMMVWPQILEFGRKDAGSIRQVPLADEKAARCSTLLHLTVQLDCVADLERAEEKDHHPGNHVAQGSLQAQAMARPAAPSSAIRPPPRRRSG